MHGKKQEIRVPAASDKRTQLIDNRELSLGDYLKERLKSQSTLKMVSAYFTIYGFQSMQKELEASKQVKFLYGDSTNIQDLDPEQKETKSFRLTDESELSLNEHLVQKPLAIECKKWIEEESVELRGIKEANLLHGKMYNITTATAGGAATGTADNAGGAKSTVAAGGADATGAVDTASAVSTTGGPDRAGSTGDASPTRDCVIGSSNFTRRGLGLNKRTSNYELNAAVTGEDCAQFEEWFDNLWHSGEVEDIKQEVINKLEELGQEQSPEFIYYKTLYEIFAEVIQEQAEAELAAEKSNFYDSKIWGELYRFQQEGVKAILHRLNKYNGCILADSVGLGKTYTALGVIKHYECRGKAVLVLAPRKLHNNWMIYKYSAQNVHNPLLADKFAYTLLSHSDLTRADDDDNLRGKAGDLNLEHLRLDLYDLVVIDESHNFRNNFPSSTEVPNDKQRRRKTRYQRLMEDIIQAGRNTQVLMLSATPINNSLSDLRNQIYLMCSGEEQNRDRHFAETIGIPNLDSFFLQAQRRFTQWRGEKVEQREKLHKVLGGDYFNLLDAISLARSRATVKEYPGVAKIIFPEQRECEKREPETDAKGEIKYETLYEDIANFTLSLYHPADYLKKGSATEQELEQVGKGEFKQSDRERSLIGMMRINMLKRLESSAHSFITTLERTIEKSREQIARIDAYQAKQQGDEQVDILKNLADPENQGEGDEIDPEEYATGKKTLKPVLMRDMNLAEWKRDIEQDQQELQKILDKVRVITAEEGRDAKLEVLRADIHNKLDNPSQNKQGAPCRKILIFTAFADTAEYLYTNLAAEVRAKGHHIALVTGDKKSCNSSSGARDFYDILASFSPGSQVEEQAGAAEAAGEIEVLIATDCISEGQNLQDCDLVLNYDIHWNPVRLIQRFGRVDRIGSSHATVKMINYWPTKGLDLYLQLHERVRDKAALVDITATGDDNLFAYEDEKSMFEYENTIRDGQLREAYNGELFDAELPQEDETHLQNFSLEHFRAELLRYIEKNRDKLENAPLGLYAVTDTESKLDEAAVRPSGGAAGGADENVPGVIFCLKQKNVNEQREKRGAGLKNNPIYPYLLIYMGSAGRVFHKYSDAKDTLNSFAKLALNKDQPDDKLCRQFNLMTDNGKKMDSINKLLNSAQQSIVGDAMTSNVEDGLSPRAGRGAKITTRENMPQLNQFELITWLYIYG